MIVVDASVLVVGLVDDGPDGDVVRGRMRGESLAAPQLLDLEVISVLRRRAQAGSLDQRRAGQALSDLIAVPVQRWPHRPLIERCWELRENLTAYDAAYVALAEMLDATLLTGDARVSRAPGKQCRTELLGAS